MNDKQKRRIDPVRILAYSALTLAMAQLLLVLLSWLCSAAFPSLSLRSLLSGEGIRWFLGRYAQVLATPVLVWIVLLFAAYGVALQSGLLRASHTYRERRARVFCMLYLVAFACIVALLSLVPHAVLLSASGSLWDSPCSRSIVPVVAFALFTTAIFYGIVAGNFQTLTDVYQSMLSGLRLAAPWLLFYLLIAQFYYSLCFVLL